MQEEEVQDLFKDENIPPSNWFKFEKVGDYIAGELIEVTDKAGEGEFPDQRVYTLRTPNDGDWNVGISKRKNYVISRADKAELGDILGFKFEKEIPAKNKGYAPAKSIQVYRKENPNKGQKDIADEF